MNVALTATVMDKLGIEFVEVDFRVPYLVVPKEHVPEVPEFIGNAVVPFGFGRWEDVALYEGQLETEVDHGAWIGVTRFEQDCWDNAIDTDDLQKGPDPWDTDTYETVLIDAMKNFDLMYAG